MRVNFVKHEPVVTSSCNLTQGETFAFGDKRLICMKIANGHAVNLENGELVELRNSEQVTVLTGVVNLRELRFTQKRKA